MRLLVVMLHSSLQFWLIQVFARSQAKGLKTEIETAFFFPSLVLHVQVSNATLH